MRALLTVLVGALMAMPVAALGGDRNTFDPAPSGWNPPPIASVPCSDDIFCSELPLDPDVSWTADGEWNPVSHRVGWVNTAGKIVITDEICAYQTTLIPNYSDPNGEVTRGFCWGANPATGDMWVGSWEIAPWTANLIHLDPAGQVIAEFTIADPAGGNMQFAGMAMDYANGHLWAALRSAVSGPTRIVEIDVNPAVPVVIQGPMPIPWLDGPDVNGRAGLEYNNTDCTILALRQRPGNPQGVSLLAKFQDLNPGGAGGIAALCDCQLLSPAACTGGGPGTNHPWGLAMVEGAIEYAMFSDLNAAPDCQPPAAGGPNDLHVILAPPCSGQCLITSVEPSTWGRIKNAYR